MVCADKRSCAFRVVLNSSLLRDGSPDLLVYLRDEGLCTLSTVSLSLRGPGLRSLASGQFTSRVSFPPQQKGLSLPYEGTEFCFCLLP